MERLKRFLAWSVPTALLLVGLGLFAGWKLFAPKPTAESRIDAQVILTALHDRGFLVSQTYIFDQPVTIEKSSGSALKDFFFGQTIVARGSMEVNLGTDLGQVSADDVTVTDGAVTIRIPEATLFNTRLVGPIDLKNDQGILKRLLDADDGYNEALSALSKAAEEAAKRPELLSRATERSREDVSRILSFVVPGKTVAVVAR